MGDVLSGWVAAIALLAGLGTMATIIALGFQRGRVQRLEAVNDDLRKEIADEVRRRESVQGDLKTATETAARDRLVIDHLTAEVRTMQNVFEAVSGPIASLTSAMRADHELLASHHKEAMSGLDYVFALQIDALRLLGDKRTPAHMQAELRAKDKEHDAPPAE